MANQFGVDLGQHYSNVENVKSSRQARAANALAMDWKKEDRQAARVRAQTLNGLRQDVNAGKEGAVGNLIAFDPEEAQQVLTAYSKMDERQREQMKDHVDKSGKMAAFVLQSEDPEQAYQRVLQNVSPEIRKGMPDQYDPQFMQMSLARARELDQMLENPEQITFGSEDRLYKDGQMVESAPSNALLKSQASGSGDGGMKSSDESLMYRQTAELFGGIFDEDGKLQNLEPDTRNKVQAVAAEAARIYQEQGGTRSGAVTKAARKLGLNIEELSGVQEGNSLKVRKFNAATGKFD